MKYITMIVVGLVVGILARFIYPGEVQMTLIMSAVLGVVGSFLAGFIGSMLDKEPGTPPARAGGGKFAKAEPTGRREMDSVGRI